MVILIRPDADRETLSRFVTELESAPHLQAYLIEGLTSTIVGLAGDLSHLDIDRIRENAIVEDVKEVDEPYMDANRRLHPEDSLIDAGGAVFGAGHFQIISGPCSVENEAQICEVARRVKASGATLLRGGAFKPRSSPYSFQGLRAEGIELLWEAKKETGLPIVSEIMNAAHLPLFEKVDVIQVGARNMQNFELLKELGRTDKPILLKRGLANTVDELLMSAEYILAGGNERVILCERGIRTFETATRNTFDVSAIPVLKKKTHLPVIADPSHAGGINYLVRPLALAAVAAGADGVMIEVHDDPTRALSDGAQSLTPDEFDALAKEIRAILSVTGRSVG